MIFLYPKFLHLVCDMSHILISPNCFLLESLLEKSRWRSSSDGALSRFRSSFLSPLICHHMSPRQLFSHETRLMCNVQGIPFSFNQNMSASVQCMAYTTPLNLLALPPYKGHNTVINSVIIHTHTVSNN